MGTDDNDTRTQTVCSSIKENSRKMSKDDSRSRKKSAIPAPVTSQDDDPTSPENDDRDDPETTRLVGSDSLDDRNDVPTADLDSEHLRILDSEERAKLDLIRETLSMSEPKLRDLRSLGCSGAGFVDDETRRDAWPRLLEIQPDSEDLDEEQTRVSNDVYQQILKDVTRSSSHFPPDMGQDELADLEDRLTKLICWVLHRHEKFNYYQGYNDVAATVLVVMGLRRGLRVLEEISLRFLERFMEPTMETVNQELFFIFALLERVHPTLLQHLENVELFPHFALAEYTTWYAHKYAENRKLLHRLFDFFLGTPTLMPLYLSTVIVAYRAKEIFDTTPDMGHTHKVLCTLPDDLPFEKLLVDAKYLYEKYPPESIENDVRDYDNKRRRKEQEWKKTAETNRLERERRRRLQVAIPRRHLPYRVGSYRTIAVVTVLAIGLYAFLKTSTGIN